MNKWQVLNKIKTQNINETIKVLLTNRGLKTKKEIDAFLNPNLSDLTIENVGIDKKEIEKSVGRIKQAIKNKEQAIVFGDYDVDGICGSAILWETLNDLGAKVLPYIPHRIDEGYGLSEIGIKNILAKHPDVSLIITVDNGIVASDAVEFANKNNIDVIITDHHVPSVKLPNAFSIIHTTALCGAGVALLLSKEIRNSKFEIRNKSQIQNHKLQTNSYLELAAIATVADLVPVMGGSRIILKFGLEELRKTKRPGLIALIKEAAIEQSEIGVFEIGHILGPRINAMGRLELAMDSLRLLCTKDEKKCEELSRKLGDTNKRRKDITIESFEHAREKVKSQKLEAQNIIITGDESYKAGVVGLIASRLVDEFYRPSIVLSIGEKFSKASARSIPGFNIIGFIRKASDLLVDVGGHPMAAGFTIENSKVEELSGRLNQLADRIITPELLERTLKIDTEIFLEDINSNFYDEVSKLAPFGIKNPQPVFMTKNLMVSDMRLVGVDGRHIKLNLKSKISNLKFDAIAFGMGNRSSEFHIGDEIDVVYQIEHNEWNGNSKLQLKIKDFR